MPSFTINLTVAQAERVAEAYSPRATGGSPPVLITTMEELKAAVVEEMKQRVLAYEHHKSTLTITVPPVDIT